MHICTKFVAIWKHNLKVTLSSSVVVAPYYNALIQEFLNSFAINTTAMWRCGRRRAVCIRSNMPWKPSNWDRPRLAWKAVTTLCWSPWNGHPVNWPHTKRKSSRSTIIWAFQLLASRPTLVSCRVTCAKNVWTTNTPTTPCIRCHA